MPTIRKAVGNPQEEGISPFVLANLKWVLAIYALIDATLVRAVLLPAVMKLLGDWNWYLPRWLEWLPRLDLERPRRSRERAPDAVPALESD